MLLLRLNQSQVANWRELDMSDLLNTYQQRNWGTDHVYLRNNDLANIWEDLTGKKTVSSSDIANLEKLINIIKESN